MGPRDPRNGLTSAALDARVPGFLGPGFIVPGLVFRPTPVSQELEYDRFAGGRVTCGVPNSPQVASNISFLFVGSLGPALLPRPGAGGTSGPVLNRPGHGPLLALSRPSEFNSPRRVSGDAPERA